MAPGDLAPIKVQVFLHLPTCLAGRGGGSPRLSGAREGDRLMEAVGDVSKFMLAWRPGRAAGRA